MPPILSKLCHDLANWHRLSLSLPCQPIFQTAINQLRFRKFTRDPDLSLPSFVQKWKGGGFLEVGETFRKRRGERGRKHSSILPANFLAAVKPTNRVANLLSLSAHLSNPSKSPMTEFCFWRERGRETSPLLEVCACSKAIRARYSFNVWIVLARVGLPCSRIERQFKASEGEKER